MDCPFCKVEEGSKYDRKVRYYFNAIELDRGSLTGFVKILTVSQSRALQILSFFDALNLELNESAFYLSVNDSFLEIELSKHELPKTSELIFYDWDLVNKPPTLSKVEQLIKTDSYEYPK